MSNAIRGSNTIPPRAPRSHRPGLAHETATDTRDASHRQQRAKQLPDVGLSRHALNVLYNVCRYGGPIATGEGITDREVSRRLSNALGVDYPPGRVSARRNELLAYERDGRVTPLVAKAPKRACRVSGNTATPWRATDAGRRLLDSITSLRQGR